jgi:hypothetical protein
MPLYVPVGPSSSMQQQQAAALLADQLAGSLLLQWPAPARCGPHLQTVESGPRLALVLRTRSTMIECINHVSAAIARANARHSLLGCRLSMVQVLLSA